MGRGLFLSLFTVYHRDNPIFLSVSQKLHKADGEDKDEKKGKKSQRQQKKMSSAGKRQIQQILLRRYHHEILTSDP